MPHARYDLPRTDMLPVAPHDDARSAAKPTTGLPKAVMRFGGAAAIAIVLAGAARSEVPRPHGTIQGTNAAVTHLAPGVGAFTYWMNGPGGEVITLVRASRNNSADVGAKDRDFVVRFSVVLAPGQTQTMTVPGIDWANPPTIHIRRLGETIEVTSNNTDGVGASRQMSGTGPQMEDASRDPN
jgi:hypothetical protein